MSQPAISRGATQASSYHPGAGHALNTHVIFICRKVTKQSFLSLTMRHSWRSLRRSGNRSPRFVESMGFHEDNLNYNRLQLTNAKLWSAKSRFYSNLKDFEGILRERGASEEETKEAVVSIPKKMKTSRRNFSCSPVP